jgi:hypothetical protein
MPAQALELALSLESSGEPGTLFLVGRHQKEKETSDGLRPSVSNSWSTLSLLSLMLAATYLCIVTTLASSKAGGDTVTTTDLSMQCSEEYTISSARYPTGLRSLLHMSLVPKILQTNHPEESMDQNDFFYLQLPFQLGSMSSSLTPPCLSPLLSFITSEKDPTQSLWLSLLIENSQGSKQKDRLLNSTPERKCCRA